jgi:hypothetical protein
MTLRRVAALAGLVLLVASLGCGRKGPPLPPRPVIPAAVGSLRAEPQDNAILVSWSRPTRNQDGSPLKDLLEFRVSRSPGPGPEGGPAGFALLATVRADSPDNAAVSGARYALLDDGRGQGLRSGARYAYRVQPVSRSGALGPPAEVAVTYTKPQ